MAKLIKTNGTVEINLKRWLYLLSRDDSSDIYVFVNNNFYSYLQVIAVVISSLIFKKDVKLICLELYNLSALCYRKERLSLNNSFLQVIKIKFHCSLISLICVFLYLNSVECIQASEPRARLFRRLLRLKHTSYSYNTYINSKSSFSYFDHYKLPTKNPYWLITGRVNDIQVLRKFIKLAAIDGCDFFVLGAPDVNSTDKNNLLNENSNLYFIQSIPSKYVRSVVEKCEKAVCIYSIKTPNQRFSSSSKVFEYADLDKPIIANYNPGLTDLKKRFSIDIKLI